MQPIESEFIIGDMQFVAKHTIPYLMRLVDVMNRKARRLEKRLR